MHHLPVIADIDDKAGEAAVQEIKDGGGDATFVKTDVREASSFDNLVGKTLATYGKLHIIFNNAGISGYAANTADAELEAWNKILSINLTGVFLGMKYAIPAILKSGGGSVINMSSIAGERGVEDEQIYCASKGGVLAMTRATAVEYAKKGIRVNCISPGSIMTEMVAALTPEAQERLIELIPQNRRGKLEEVAHAALFLAADECQHVIGHNLVVDGGWEIDSGFCLKMA